MLACYIPEQFTKRLIHPLLKKHDVEGNIVNMYRPIIMAPIIAKLFEYYLCPVLEPYYNSHSNQSGSIRNGGRNRAIFNAAVLF